MEKTEDIIFKPEVVPNKNWVKELDRRHMDSSFSSFRAPADDKRIITLCRPFVVLSKTTYSTPVTLPLGLAYLAGVLEKAGYKTKIIDAIGEDHPVKIRRSHDNKYNIQGLNSDEILEKIDPDTFIIGITLMFSLEWFAQRVLIEKIRKKFPNAIIVVGGEHASSVSEFTLRDCPSIDYVIKGEGEFSMLEFSHLMFNGRDVTNIPGLCFVNEKNQFVDNGLSKRIEHIDTLPRPAWHLLKPENYFIDNFAFGLSGGRNMPILATRGCPYQCTFCSSPSMWTTRYIMRKPEEIVDEIEWLKQEYQASSFEFFDLTAIIKRTWIFEFCAELKKRKLEDITWQLPVGTRSESLDKETLQALYDTGCRFIKYAPESGSEKSLAMIKKRVKIDRLNKSVKAANKIGHTTSLNFIIGFPHETVIDCLKTIFFGTYSAIRFGPYDINYAVFVPYPGSELFESLKKKKKIEINDKYFESLHMQFDITTTESYCENVSGKMLSFLRLLGFASSYSAIYLSRPKRIYMLIKNIFKDRFFANNLFEQRVYDVYRRYKLKR